VSCLLYKHNHRVASISKSSTMALGRLRPGKDKQVEAGRSNSWTQSSKSPPGSYTRDSKYYRSQADRGQKARFSAWIVPIFLDCIKQVSDTCYYAN
jgi:DNA/RNA endonuclease G (NUC1)